MSNFLEKAEVKNRFVSIFKGVYNLTSDVRANDLFEVEKFHFLKLISENPKLSECSQNSTVGTFLDVVSNGLSFEKAQGHIYVMSRNVKTGQKNEHGKDVYELRMSYEIAKNGVMRMVKRSGSVVDIVDPVIVYKGDDIKVTTENGIKNILHSPAIPRQSNTMLGAYCFVITSDGRREGFWYPVENVSRLMAFSSKQNKAWDADKKMYVDGQPNDLYTSGTDGQIDEGFFCTKVVKAALKNYSKQPTGMNHVNDGEYNDADEENIKQYAAEAEVAAGPVVCGNGNYDEFEEIPSEF